MSQQTWSFGEYRFSPVGFVRYWEIGERCELMQQLESFLASVLDTDQVPFDIRQEWGRERAVRNPKGMLDYRSLSGFLPLCGQWMDLYWPGYAYSADWRLFFDCFMQHPFARVFGYGAPAGIYNRTQAASLFNDFVACLRTEAVRRGVKKSLADGRANLGEQETSVRRYLGELPTQYPSLVPIRVDLNYAEGAFDGTDAMPRTGWAVSDSGVWMPVPSNTAIGHGRPEARARIDTAVAMADRDRLFDNRRGADKQLFDRMVGYICKLEEGGRHRANHFHCVFLIDARGLRQSDVYALKYGLGDRWRRVTGGQGLMYDSHERPDRQAIRARGQWAIDPIDCANPVQVATFINYIVWYFTKDDDQLVRVKPTARARTLTMGR
ncbi:hypothetical protein P5X00_14600 [Paraburkholderia sp. A2RO-4L]|uniref:hypothetical protein n=1 Tax=Paraburkholderia sp. A2RO-4L TaxID=3028374 RepID=UPI003DA8F5C8